MKKSVKLLLLLLLLALLLAGYAAATHFGGAGKTDESEVSQPLSALTEADMPALSWTNANGSFRFEQSDGIWMNADDAQFPVDQSVVGALAGRIAGLTATRKLEGASDPADYGLDDPELTVTAEGADGASTTYAMGDATPFDDGYYVGVSGDDAIYTVASSLTDAFDKTATELAALESIPQAEDVARLSVGAFEAARDGSGAWRDAATGERLDGEAVEALANGANDLSWSALVEVSADDAALETYGLGEAAMRVTLCGADGEEARTLLFGAEDEDGDRYARLPDSTMVYTVYGGDVEDLLAAGADTLYAKAPVPLALDGLATADFAWDGGTLTLTRTPLETETPEAEDDADEAEGAEEAPEAAETAETDEASDADGAPKAAYAANGETVDAAQAEALWEALTALEATARVEETAQGEAVLRVTFAGADGEAQSVAFYPRDVDSYLVPVTDAHALLVPADGVDKLVRMLKQL